MNELRKEGRRGREDCEGEEDRRGREGKEEGKIDWKNRGGREEDEEGMR